MREADSKISELGKSIRKIYYYDAPGLFEPHYLLWRTQCDTIYLEADAYFQELQKFADRLKQSQLFKSPADFSENLCTFNKKLETMKLRIEGLNQKIAKAKTIQEYQGNVE